MRTSIVHRATKGPSPWWHASTILSPSTLYSPATESALQEEARRARAAGFDAVLIEPETSAPLVAPESPLAAFISGIRGSGLRVLVRIPNDTLSSLGARGLDMENRVSSILARTRGALAAGADGVDLGVCVEEDDSSPVRAALARERFAALVRQVEAEAASWDSQPIVTARIDGADAERVRSHLEEEWFHHLCDDSLRRASWSAEAIRDAVVSSLAVRDRVGAVAPWSFDLTATPERLPLPARESALLVYALSLPGAVHAVCSRPDALGDTAPGSFSIDEAAARALRARIESGLGTGALGFVDGLEWAGPGVSVHANGPVLVVLNTSDALVRVPASAGLLLSSAPVEVLESGESRVPADCCAWFETPRIRPKRAAYWD